MDTIAVIPTTAKIKSSKSSQDRKVTTAQFKLNIPPYICFYGEKNK